MLGIYERCSAAILNLKDSLPLRASFKFNLMLRVLEYNIYSEREIDSQQMSYYQIKLLILSSLLYISYHPNFIVDIAMPSIVIQIIKSTEVAKGI